MAALKELGLTPSVTVPEPNTWREVLSALDAATTIRGKQIAVEEYGIPNPELVSGLEQRGASVKTIAVYRWALPEDLAPLRDAIQQILRGAVDVALFTNGAQVEHVFRVAAEEKADEKLRAACKAWRSARSVRFVRGCCNNTGSSRILSRHIPRWDR